MKATIELYEPLHDHLKTKTKYGESKGFVYVVKIGHMIIIKPSESSADKYLTKMGFVLNEDVEYELRHKSDDEIFLEINYRKLN